MGGYAGPPAGESNQTIHKLNSPVITYPAKLDLLGYDVYYEDNSTSPSIFILKDIPEYFTYGKTTIFLGYNNTMNQLGYSLRVGSDILMEVTDSHNNIIFSELVANRIENSTVSNSGFGAAYIRIDKNPDRTYDYIQDGLGYITLLGELDGNIPQSWKGHYNCRIKYPIQIRKDLPKISKLYFYDYPLVNMKLATADESSAGKRSGVPSVIKKYNTMQFDNLNTVGGKVSFIEVSYRSDANDLSQSNASTPVDTFPVEPVELLTPTGSEYYADTTWIGNNVAPEMPWASSHASVAAILDFWDIGGQLGGNCTDSNYVMGLNGLKAAWQIDDGFTYLPGGVAIRMVGSCHPGFPSSSNDGYFAKYFRKTGDEEKFTIRYNISGSGGVVVKSALSSSDELIVYKEDADGNPISGFDTRAQYIPADNESITTLYSASFEDFKPQDFSGSIINGIQHTDRPYELSHSMWDEQIIQDDFTAPSSSYLAVYFIANRTGSGDGVYPYEVPVVFNNMSIKHQKLDDTNPPVYYRALNIPGGASREETQIYSVRYLNSNMDVAQDLNYPDQEITSSVTQFYTAESFWLERGAGAGTYGNTATGDQVFSVAARFTNVTSGSINEIPSSTAVSTSVGIWGESSTYDEWGSLKNMHPGGSYIGDRTNELVPNYRGGSIGGVFIGARPSQSSYTNNNTMAAGIYAAAYDSGSNTWSNGPKDKLYSGIFANGDVIIVDNLSMSGDFRTSGDIHTEGNIYADEFHTTYTSSSIIYKSGSTEFGDSKDDIHIFTGSLYISGSSTLPGSISASTTITARDLVLIKKGGGGTSYTAFEKAGNTAAGNIWYDEYGGALTASIIMSPSNDMTLTNNMAGKNINLTPGAGGKNTFSRMSEFTGNITASLNISASGYITASNMMLTQGTLHVSGTHANTPGPGIMLHSASIWFTGNSGGNSGIFWNAISPGSTAASTKITTNTDFKNMLITADTSIQSSFGSFCTWQDDHGNIFGIASGSGRKYAQVFGDISCSVNHDQASVGGGISGSRIFGQDSIRSGGTLIVDGLTSGRVPFIFTDGAIQDDSDFTYNQQKVLGVSSINTTFITSSNNISSSGVLIGHDVSATNNGSTMAIGGSGTSGQMYVESGSIYIRSSGQTNPRTIRGVNVGETSHGGELHIKGFDGTTQSGAGKSGGSVIIQGGNRKTATSNSGIVGGNVIISSSNPGYIKDNVHLEVKGNVSASGAITASGFTGTPYAYVVAKEASGDESSPFEFLNGNGFGHQSLSHSMHWDTNNNQHTMSIGGVYEINASGVFDPTSITSKYSYQIVKNSNIVYETDSALVHIATSAGGKGGSCTWVGTLDADDAIQLRIDPGDATIAMKQSGSYSIKKIS